MTREFEVNPLDVLEMRRFVYLPPHFSPLKINGGYNKPDIAKWIESNLKGRYFLGTTTVLENNNIATQDIVAFEDHRESTLFFLSCPLLPKLT
jgi:hypothetical protein